MRKRRADIAGPDPREAFLDRLMKDAAGTRQEMAQRRREFWAAHAVTAANELTRAEIAVRCAERKDLPGLWLAERLAHRTLAELAQRAGIDAGALIERARAEAAAAAKAEEATAGHRAQAAPDAEERMEGEQVA